jgi:hypothetical protein
MIAPPNPRRGTTAPPTPRMRMPNATATLAPPLMPMMSGLASGLRRRVWKTAPAIPNAAPTSSPSTIGGRRSRKSTKESLGSPCPRRARSRRSGEMA